MDGRLGRISPRQEREAMLWLQAGFAPAGRASMQTDSKWMRVTSGVLFASTLLISTAMAQGIKIDTPTAPTGCRNVSQQVNPGKSFYGKKCVTNTNGCSR